MGGNNQSRYNWNINADNKDADWYFESIGDPSAVPGYRADSFIQGNKAANADTMMTIPMLSWVAKLGPNRGKLSSFSIAKYGPQTDKDSNWMPDAGNGVSTASGNPFITGNDPNDANVPSDVAFQEAWINHMFSKWGSAAKGGVKYYEMDNESSIWFSTHRDVHPIGPKMDEILGDILSYGNAVKNIDPTAKVCAPEEWGWDAYLNSGYDQQYASLHNWTGHPDQDAHGGMLYMPYLLQSIRTADVASKRRTLDVFTLHYYPQDGSFGDGVIAAQQKIRNASTRSLWDPNYVDQSWVNTQIDLIPRMHGWVNTYYPGTQIGITEYNFGAESNINGATAQADVFGILGQQQVDLATRWTCPDPSTPPYKAMKLYRNYDGLNNGFGDVSVSDTGNNNPDNVSSFAATRTKDGALTVVVINKVATSAVVNLNLKNFTGDNLAQVWQLTSANTITRNVDLIVRNSLLPLTVPGQSVTLLVFPPSTVKETKPAPITSIKAHGLNAAASVSWTGGGGATYYRVYRSLSANTGYAVLGIAYVPTYTDSHLTNGTTYYYKVEAVDPVGPSAPSAAATATPSVPAPDPSKYSFETGVQGWTGSGGMIGNLATSYSEHFLGGQSLAVPISAAASDTQDALVSSPSVPAGATVTFHIWLPAGCLLSSIQPYVLQGSGGGWLWTGNWQPLSSLQTNAWNTLKVTVPANAITPMYQLGVEFSTSTAWSGTCYIDSVSW
jgi:hypothetical protein